MRRLTLNECRTALAACPPDELDALISKFASDPRSGVRALASARRRAVQRETAEAQRLLRLAERQRLLHGAGYAIVVGLDEVGRGALAGPVTAAAVVLEVTCLIDGLNDSKRLTPEIRVIVDRRVRAEASAVCVAHATPGEIDSVGIGEATRMAWRRAVEGLSVVPDHVLVDGSDSRTGFPTTAIVGGDSSCGCIAAASVVAKVARDSLMGALALEHPGYGFEANRGYGTAEHLAAIATLGPSPVHRRSFAPCSQVQLF